MMCVKAVVRRASSQGVSTALTRCSVRSDIPHSSNFPNLPGVPAAALSFVLFRYVTCSSNFICLANSLATSPPLSPRKRLSFIILVTSATRSAAPETNMTVGAPLCLGFWASRVRRVGTTEKRVQLSRRSSLYRELSILLVIKSTSWSRLLDPFHSVVSTIEVSAYNFNETFSRARACKSFSPGI